MTPTASIVKPWIRTNLGLLLSYLGLLISTIILMSLLVRVGLRGELHYVGANVLPMAYAITWLLIVTTFVRTIGWRIVNRAFFMGMFTMMAIAYPASRFMKVPFGETVFTTSVWVPLSEETARLGRVC